MIAPPNDGEHGDDHRVEIRRHLRVAGADHHVPAAHELTIPPAVTLESSSIAVPVVPVGLDDETFPDQEVDSADACDDDLTSRADSMAAQSETHKRLDPGFCCRVV